MENISMKNDFLIIGKVVDKEFTENINKNNKEYISGSLTIEVKKKINDELLPNLFEVNFFSFKLKNDGTENNYYKGYKTLEEELKIGDIVRVNGNLKMEEYYNKKRGKISRFQKYSATTISRLSEEELNTNEPTALATIDTVVLDSQVDEEGKMKVDCFTLNYNNEYLELFNVYVKDNLKDAFPSLYFPGTTGELTYELYNYAQKSDKNNSDNFAEQGLSDGFGEQIRVDDNYVFDNKVSYIEIIGGKSPYNDGPKALLNEDIEEIISKHNQKLDELRSEENLEPKQAFGQTFEQSQEKTLNDSSNPFI